MPKKLKFKKTKQEGICNVFYNIYRTVSFWDNKGEKEYLKYYQVQKNRRKILNTKKLEVALRRMMTEANYELQNLYNNENNNNLHVL